MDMLVDGAVLHAAFAGVDTHKDTHMLGLKDALGRTIGTWEFPATPAGYDALADFIGDASVPVGIEGTRSYGAGLAERLAERGYRVYEVIRPNRAQRRRGKTDAIDALAACDAVSSGKGLPVKELGGDIEAVRYLMIAREQFIDTATKAANRIDSMLVTAPKDIRERWRDMRGEARMRAICATKPKDGIGKALRAVACQWRDAMRRADELEGDIAALINLRFPLLIGEDCVGAISAGRLIVAAGSNPGRMRSEAAFSMLCGTSPIPASSGRTDRHRLNRGGDRQANRAIHEIARAKMAHDEKTKEYITRKMSEGKTKKEAVRALCRFISRRVYRLLTASQACICDQSGLLERRVALGLTQACAAEGAGITLPKLGRLERMQGFDTQALAAYDAYLSGLENNCKLGLDSI